MKDPAVVPEEVGPDEHGTRLRIRWRDGHVSSYQPRTLRLACPCAGCVDEITGERVLRPSNIAEDVHPREIRYVGRYALQFFWSDGHETGIYPFTYLRKLCPCPECEGRGGD